MTKKSPDQFFIDLSVLVKRLLNRTPQHMEVVHDINEHKTFKTKNIRVGQWSDAPQTYQFYLKSKFSRFNQLPYLECFKFKVNI